MTNRELKVLLETLTEEQLDMDITIHDAADEYYTGDQVVKIMQEGDEGCDVVEPGTLVFHVRIKY